MNGRATAGEKLRTGLGAAAIGIIGFLALEGDCRLRNWPAPADPREMSQLVRAALVMRNAPNDAPRLESLEQFAEEVADFPHWRAAVESSASQVGREYHPEELAAFINDLAEFYNDEWAKPAETYYYYLFWYRREFQAPDWSSSRLARTNPTMAKFLLGLGIDLQTKGSFAYRRPKAEDMYGRWGPFEPFLLAAMDRPVLEAARRTSLVFGAGTLVVTFLFGCRLGGRVGVATGLLAARLLYASPIFQFYATRATVDVMLLFFMMLGGWATTFFVPAALRASDGSWRAGCRLWVLAGVMGIVVGFAFGVKMNGCLVGIGAAVACGLGWAIARARGLSGTVAPGASTAAGFARISLALCAVAALSIAIFWGSNPYYYRDPIGRLRATLSEMQQVIDGCQKTYGPAVYSRSEAVRAVYHYGAMLAGRHGWGMVARSRTRPFEPMDRTLIVAPGRYWSRSAFVVTGLVLAIVLLARRLRIARDADQAGVLVSFIGWSVTLIAGTVLWLPLRWDRYLLVAIAPGIVLVSFGWSAAAGAVIGRLRRFIVGPAGEDSSKVAGSTAEPAGTQAAP